MWGQQIAAWLGVVFLTKLILLALLLPSSKPLGAFAVWLYGPVRGHPDLELVIVMVVVPCVLNALQFWVSAHARTHTHARTRTHARAHPGIPPEQLLDNFLMRHIHNRRRKNHAESLSDEEEADVGSCTSAEMVHKDSVVATGDGGGAYVAVE